MLSAANSYYGGTTINGGTLQVGADNALGLGQVSFSAAARSPSDSTHSRALGNYLNIQGSIAKLWRCQETTGRSPFSGLVNLAQPARPNLTIASPVTLAGNVISGGFSKDGAGMLTLLGANTYAGSTTISQGALHGGQRRNERVGGYGHREQQCHADVLSQRPGCHSMRHRQYPQRQWDA